MKNNLRKKKIEEERKKYLNSEGKSYSWEEVKQMAINKEKRVNHTILEQEKDWWDDLSNNARAFIKRGMDDAKAGRVAPHEVVMKSIASLR